MLKISPEIYEIIALAARYIFVLLGVLIVLRAYGWLLSAHREKQDRLHRLPDAGMIGELAVLSGVDDLPENAVLPVPREGILGSVRSCDITVPGEGIRRQHLSFVWDDACGLRLRLHSGCEAILDGNSLNVRSPADACIMHHGSFLQLGSALLRLRVFAGLDPNAGFESAEPEQHPAAPEGAPAGSGPEGSLPFGYGAMPQAAANMNPLSPWRPEASMTPAAPEPWMTEVPMNPAVPGSWMPEEQSTPAAPEPWAAEAVQDPETNAAAESVPPAGPRRRSDRASRWKEDWSE